MRVGLLHPFVPLVYYAGLFIFIFMCVHPLYRGVLVLGILSLALMFNGLRKTWMSLRVILPLSLVFGLMNPLFVHRGATILFYFSGNPITLEAAAYGAHNGLMMLCVMLFFISFNRVIDQSAFLYLTARWAPRAAFMMDMALHAVTVYRTRLAEFADVQATRGVSLTRGSFGTRLNAALTLLLSFTFRTLEEGMETAEVLKARDYGTVRRSAYRLYTFGRRDAIGLVAVCIVLVPVMIGCLQGAGRFLFYPRLQSLVLDTGEGTIYALFAGYLLLPILYESFGFVTRGRNRYAH